MSMMDFASGDDVVQVRDHGRTNCVDDKCAANDQTSAPLFNPLLWGAIPNRLRAGDSWTTTISKPWEIGPAGVERVRVAGLVPASGLVMLVREGEGEGPSSDDARRPSLPIVAGNKKLACRVILGKAHWRGVATVIRGVTWADEIVVERPVELVADSGERFTGTQRVYTLFQRSPTSLGDPMRSGA